MHAHLVLGTKFRHNVIGDQHLPRMEQIMRDVCRDFEAELVEFNGENNNIHLLVNYPPKVAVARLVNSLKGVSSRRLRQGLPDLVRHFYRANKLWSGPYFAGSVGGASLSIVERYMSNRTARLKALLEPWRPSQRGPSPPARRPEHRPAFR